jgi:hypothetical protein
MNTLFYVRNSSIAVISDTNQVSAGFAVIIRLLGLFLLKYSNKTLISTR